MISGENIVRVVINRSYGGFNLPEHSLNLYAKRKGLKDIRAWEIPRDDPVLVEIVRGLGDDSPLKIVEVPDGVNWYIDDYDGSEWVAERHRRWY